MHRSAFSGFWHSINWWRPEKAHFAFVQWALLDWSNMFSILCGSCANNFGARKKEVFFRNLLNRVVSSDYTWLPISNKVFIVGGKSSFVTWELLTSSSCLYSLFSIHIPDSYDALQWDKLFSYLFVFGLKSLFKLSAVSRLACDRRTKQCELCDCKIRLSAVLRNTILINCRIYGVFVRYVVRLRRAYLFQFSLAVYYTHEKGKEKEAK